MIQRLAKKENQRFFLEFIYLSRINGLIYLESFRAIIHLSRRDGLLGRVMEVGLDISGLRL